MSDIWSLQRRFAFGGNLDRDEVQTIFDAVERLKMENAELKVTQQPLYSRRLLEQQNTIMRDALKLLRRHVDDPVYTIRMLQDEINEALDKVKDGVTNA